MEYFRAVCLFVIVIFIQIYFIVIIKDSPDIKIMNLSNNFKSYMAKFNKTYQDSEYLLKMKHFNESLQDIRELNAKHGARVFGLTKFSDMSIAEFISKILSPLNLGTCYNLHRSKCPPRSRERNDSYVLDRVDDIAIPQKFDWRNKGVVGPVLNQKYCQGCWAFSIVSVMESMSAISGKGFTQLSIQELLDCSDYNNGCNKGDVSTALDFLCSHDYPIVTGKNYPLMLVDQPCKMPQHTYPSGRKIAEFTSICDIDELETLRLIATHGPVVAVVNAVTWINYIDGVIMTACEGDWRYLNHVVTLVGYDLTGEIPYYIAKNSWGDDFGNGGYVKLMVGKNVCGVARNVAYFTVK